MSEVRTPVPAYNVQYPYQLSYAHRDVSNENLITHMNRSFANKEF